MPKTREITIMGKKFIIHDFPLQLIDWVQLRSKKITDAHPNQKATQSIELEHEVLQKFVAEPEITNDYLANEAGLPEYKLFKYIMQTITDSSDVVIDDIKKS